MQNYVAPAEGARRGLRSAKIRIDTRCSVRRPDASGAHRSERRGFWGAWGGEGGGFLRARTGAGRGDWQTGKRAGREREGAAARRATATATVRKRNGPHVAKTGRGGGHGEWGMVERVPPGTVARCSERRLSTARKRNAFGVAKKQAGQSVLGRRWHALLHGIGRPGRRF